LSNFNLKKSELNDPKGLAKVCPIKRYISYIKIKNDEDLDYIVSLVKAILREK
jgi:hypothetical protein